MQKGLNLFFICCCGILGIGLFSAPTAAAHFGQTFYWGYLLIGGVVAFVSAMLCAVTAEPLPQTYRTCFPKAGRYFCMLHTLFYTLLSAFLLAYYTHTLQGWFLDSVPRSLLALFLVSVCGITATKPERTLRRSIALLTVLVLLAVLTMRLLMLASGNLTDLLPLFEAEYTQNLPKGGIFMSGFFVMVGLLGNVHASRRTKAWAGGTAVLLCTALLILACAGCISILGPIQTANHLNSSVLAMKNLNLSKMDFFQRGDIVFILTWSVLILCTGTLCCHIPYRTIQNTFPSIRTKCFSAVLLLLYAAVALLMPDEETALLCLMTTALCGGGVVLVLLPVILRIVQRRNSR